MKTDTKKIALVTGSEGHIGRQISRRLISEGYFVYGIMGRFLNAEMVQ